jgi:hypothetical protein
MSPLEPSVVGVAQQRCVTDRVTHVTRIVADLGTAPIRAECHFP